MQLQQPFNPAHHDPNQSASQLPVGKHPVIIDGDEILATNAKDGSYMHVLDLTIIDGPMKGQTGVYRLNLYNKSQTSCEIAHKQLSAICHVTGMAATIIQDMQQLHNKPFYVQVDPQKDKPEYTQVTKVFDINGNEPGKAPVQQQAPQGFVAPAAPPEQNAFQQPATPAGGFGQPAAPAQQGAPAQTQAWPTAPAQAPAAQTAGSVPPWLQNK